MAKWGLALAMFFLQPQIGRPALEWFEKGEAMIGTPQAYTDEQAECFAEAVKLEPDFAAARFNLALIRVRQSRFEDAIQQLDVLVALEPEQPRGLLLRGETFLRKGESAKAENDFAAALTLAPDEAAAWRYLGQARYEQGKIEPAREALEKARQLDPSLAGIHFDLALTAAAAGRKAEAIDLFQAHLAESPEDVDALVNLAALLRERGDLQQAVQTLREAVALKPAQVELNTEIGFLYLDLNQPDEAAKWLEGSDSAAALANLGLIAGQKGEHDKAAGYLSQAVRKEPSNGELWAGLGDALYFQGKAEAAADAYRKALDLGASDAATRLNLGTLYANAGRDEEAARLLLEGLELDPGSGVGHFHLGIVLERLNRPEEALDRYRQALAHGADGARLHFRMAALLSRAGEGAEALRHLEACLNQEAGKYLPLIEKELLNVHSDLDAVRYTTAFAELLKKHRGETSSNP